MQISDLATWFVDPSNFGTIVSAATSIVALILGLIIGGMIVSSQSGKQTRTADEHAKASVVAEVLDATTELAVFASLPPAAQAASDRAVARINVRLRVLPVQGAGSVADWTGHQLNELKRASSVGVTAAQTTLDLLRDRLVLWIYNPKRAAKQCQRDLERWSFVSGGTPSSGGRRTNSSDFPDMNATNPFAGTASVPGAPVQVAPPAPAAAPAAMPATPGPAPVPAATSSIPAAAAAHAQAAAAQPKDPFEDLLGPGPGARR
jgi:DNA polymerase-3 subunit gamma/tau